MVKTKNRIFNLPSRGRAARAGTATTTTTAATAAASSAASSLPVLAGLLYRLGFGICAWCDRERVDEGEKRYEYRQR
jgi:hypothetical protein